MTPGLKATLRVAGLKSLNLKRLFTCLQQTVTHTALLTMLDNYETNLLEYNVAPTDSLGPSDLGGAERDAMRTPGMCTVVEHRRYRDRHFVTQGAKACICAHTLCSCVLTRSIMPYARPLYVPVQFCMSGAPVRPRCPYMPPGAPACLFTPGTPVCPRYPCVHALVSLYAPGTPACYSHVLHSFMCATLNDRVWLLPATQTLLVQEVQRYVVYTCADYSRGENLSGRGHRGGGQGLQNGSRLVPLELASIHVYQGSGLWRDWSSSGDARELETVCR